MYSVVILLLELKDCNPALLNDLNYIRQAMLTAAEDVGATVVGESFHHFTPQGVTGILAIAESISRYTLGRSMPTPPPTYFPAGARFTPGKQLPGWWNYWSLATLK